MATTISSGTNPYKLGSPPDFGTLYSGRALEFDGVTDYVDLSNVGLGTDDFTISVWVKTSQSSEGQIIRTATSAPLVILGMDSSALRFEMNDGSSSKNNASIATISDGMWHYIVASVDRNVSGKVYVDGSLVLTDTDYADVDATLTQAGVSAIGKRPTTSTQYFDGNITNFQIWDKAWSLSDVQYAYTHPEKLITDNSAVTSGTTISNLKAWYPCTEGNPRSPQTTVYDGSPKELGSELVTNGGFDEDASWAKGGSATISGGAGYLPAATTGTLSQASAIIVGKVYYYTLSAKSADDGTLNLSDGTSTHASIEDVPTGYTTYTGYFTAANTSVTLSESSTGNIYIDSISIKEVQMGNHGTTTFYGDELNTTANASSPTNETDATTGWTNASWVPSGGGGTAAGMTSVTQGAEPSGSKSIYFLGETDDYGGEEFTVVVGRTYRVVLQYITNGQPTNILLGTSLAGSQYSATSVTATGWTTLTSSDITATSTSLFVSFQAIASGADKAIWIDTVSLKEIGVAAGWTTADAEPLIPQTALMGMSKPIVFDGIDDCVTGSAVDIGTSFSLSMWIKADVINTTQYIFSISNSSSHRASVRLESQKIDMSYYDSDGAGYENTETSSNVITSVDTWYHIVWTGISGGTKTVYVNGASQATSSGSTHSQGNEFNIGQKGDDSGFFNGIITEVAAWDSVITLAEVQAIFNDGVALDVSSDSGDYESSSDLVGYWRNDGAVSWSDRSTNSVAGTVFGSPDTILLPEGTTSGKDILGFPLTHTNNGWLNLDGSEYVDVVGAVDFILAPKSISAWVNSDGGTGYIVAHTGTDRIAIYVSATTWETSIYDGGYASYNQTGVTPGTEGWTHIVLTWDGNDRSTMKMYKNGALTGSLNGSAGIGLAGTAKLYIGVRTDGSSYFKGQIDEVRAYDKTLSAAEVLKNYKHGKGKHS